jgi:hypothetical protein
MAIVNSKSTAVTNVDATPTVITNRILTRGPLYSAVGVIAKAASDNDTSVFRAVRVPSNARIVSILRGNTAITAGTSYQIGVYATAQNGGAAVSAGLFAATQDLSTASGGTASRYLALGVATGEQRLWELLGLTSDPRVDYDICLTGVTAGTGAGTLLLDVTYTV